MREEFKPGDKVRCISECGELILGAVYTFKKYELGYSKNPERKIVHLEELHGAGYFAYRFELAERKISFDNDIAKEAIRLVTILYKATNSKSEYEDSKNFLIKVGAISGEE